MIVAVSPDAPAITIPDEPTVTTDPILLQVPPVKTSLNVVVVDEHIAIDPRMEPGCGLAVATVVT
jgi:hypothetical protein